TRANRPCAARDAAIARAGDLRPVTISADRSLGITFRIGLLVRAEGESKYPCAEGRLAAVRNFNDWKSKIKVILFGACRMFRAPPNSTSKPGTPASRPGGTKREIADPRSVPIEGLSRTTHTCTSGHDTRLMSINR